MLTTSAHKLDRLLACVIFLAVVGIGVILVPRIGPAWDEPDNIFSGGQYANFFQNGFDRQVLLQTNQDASIFGKMIYSQEPAIARYPPVPNYIGTALSLLGERLWATSTSTSIIMAFHVATVLFFALLIATVYMFGRLLGLSRAGSIFASAVTLLYPTLFGHGLSNLKDTAQVALFTLSLYFVVQGTLTKKRHDLVLGAIVWGLALASKFNAVYVPIIWLVWSLLSSKKKPLLIAYWLLVILTIGLVVTTVVWPYLWFEGVAHGREIIRYFTSVGQGFRLFWDGHLYQVGVGGIFWWYPWANLLFVTPISLLVLALTGVASIVRRVVNTKRATTRLLLLFWFVIPLLRAFLPHAAFYDGMRHFLEVLPAGILIAAIGAEEIIMLLRKKYTFSLLHGYIVLSFVLAHLVWINVTYFPYSTGYYNALAQNPNVRFDRDIEALSVREAVDYLHANYGAISLWSPIGGHLAWYYLTPGDRYVYTRDEADSIILINKSSHIRRTEFERLIEQEYVLDEVISRGDAVFAWIYRRK